MPESERVLDRLGCLLSQVPADELAEFGARLEASTRDLTLPGGRRPFALLALSVIDAVLAGASLSEVLGAVEAAVRVEQLIGYALPFQTVLADHLEQLPRESR